MAIISGPGRGKRLGDPPIVVAVTEPALSVAPDHRFRPMRRVCRDSTVIVRDYTEMSLFLRY